MLARVSIVVRKTVTISTTALLAASLAAPAVMARNFDDLGGHWSARFVQQMAAKGVITGYSDNTVRPDRQVSRVEAVVMLVRALGLEEIAANINYLPQDFQRREEVADWAKGFVALAAEDGILTDTDKENFRPSQAASRAEIAVWAVRALGLAERAAGLFGSALDFTDVDALPNWVRGYIAVAAQEGIMVGNPDGTFAPSGLVTRGQMATLLARIDDRQTNELDQHEKRGVLRAVNAGDGRLTLRLDDGTETELRLATGADIFRLNLSASALALKVGDEIRAVGGSDGLILFVAASPSPVETKGTIHVVDEANRQIVIKKTGDALATVTVGGSARIGVDGVTAGVADLVKGQEVTVQERDGQVVEIVAKSVLREFQAVLQSMITTPTARLLVVAEEDADGDLERVTYTLSPEVKVTKNNREATLSDLVVNDRATLVTKNLEVVIITAESHQRVLEGTLTAVKFGNPAVVEFRGDLGDFRYPVASGASLKRGGKTVGLTSLRAGDEVTIRVTGGEIVKIDADLSSEKVTGIVKYVTLARGLFLTITRQDGTETTYPFTSKTYVEVEGEEASYMDLQPGYQVTVILKGDEVKTIQATGAEQLAELSGKVLYVDERAGVVVLETTEDGAAGSEFVYVNSDTVVVRFSRVARDIDLVVPGDRVIAVGTRTGGRFTASSIVVTAAGE